MNTLTQWKPNHSSMSQHRCRFTYEATHDSLSKKKSCGVNVRHLSLLYRVQNHESHAEISEENHKAKQGRSVQTPGEGGRRGELEGDAVGRGTESIWKVLGMFCVYFFCDSICYKMEITVPALWGITVMRIKCYEPGTEPTTQVCAAHVVVNIPASYYYSFYH